MANPGYGKRSVHGQQPRSAEDFKALPDRDRAIGSYIDRAPDGADISVKGLAKVLPYGQCAIRTSLRRLRQAGHLRYGREHLILPDASRWVTRSWFSRTARDNDWWATFVTDNHLDAQRERATEQPAQDPEPVSDPPESDGAEGYLDDAPYDEEPDENVTGSDDATQDDTTDTSSPDDTPPPPTTPVPPNPTRGPAKRSPACSVLVELGLRAPTVALSAADCAALAPLAAVWFARGATPEYILRTLTDGLPSPIHHPAGLIRTRLTSKLPPEPLPQPDPVTAPATRPAMRFLVCGTCRTPDRPDAVIDGECGTCRGETPPPRHPATLPPDRVIARAADTRAAMVKTSATRAAPNRTRATLPAAGDQLRTSPPNLAVGP
jgi:hypothetical protein